MKKIQHNTYLICAILLSLSFILIVFIGITKIPSGYFSLIDLAPEGFVFEEPDDTSPENALSAIVQTQNEIILMRQNNFSTTFVEDALNEANQSYQEEDYLNVFRLAQLISYLHEEDKELRDRVELLHRELETERKRNKVDTSETEALVGLAMEAFQQEQFEEAQLIIEDAEVELDKARLERTRVKELARLSRNFFLRYWWQILIILIVLGIVTPPLFKKIQRKRKEQKLAHLEMELVKTRELIKRLQKNCFVEKKITPRSYKNKVANYEERMAEIKHTIPVLKAQLKGKKGKSVESTGEKKVKGVIEVKR